MFRTLSNHTMAQVGKVYPGQQAESLGVRVRDQSTLRANRNSDELISWDGETIDGRNKERVKKRIAALTRLRTHASSAVPR